MASFVRLLAIAAAAVIGLSLIMFAIDQSSEGTETQLRSLDGQTGPAPSQASIDAPDPDPSAERLREQQHSSVREYIDDGNDILASPFTGIASSDSIWIKRLVPAVIGLLLFGLGGLLLANWLPQGETEHRDWRETRA